MAVPSRTPRSIRTINAIHQPGYGPTDDVLCPEGTELTPHGAYIPWPTGEGTLIPWGNIAHIIWDAAPETTIVPLKSVKRAKPV